MAPKYRAPFVYPGVTDPTPYVPRSVPTHYRDPLRIRGSLLDPTTPPTPDPDTTPSSVANDAQTQYTNVVYGGDADKSSSIGQSGGYAYDPDNPNANSLGFVAVGQEAYTNGVFDAANFGTTAFETEFGKVLGSINELTAPVSSFLDDKITTFADDFSKVPSVEDVAKTGAKALGYTAIAKVLGLPGMVVSALGTLAENAFGDDADPGAKEHFDGLSETEKNTAIGIASVNSQIGAVMADLRSGDITQQQASDSISEIASRLVNMAPPAPISTSAPVSAVTSQDLAAPDNTTALDDIAAANALEAMGIGIENLSATQATSKDLAFDASIADVRAAIGYPSTKGGTAPSFDMSGISALSSGIEGVGVVDSDGNPVGAGFSGIPSGIPQDQHKAYLEQVNKTIKQDLERKAEKRAAEKAAAAANAAANAPGQQGGTRGNFGGGGGHSGGIGGARGFGRDAGGSAGRAGTSSSGEGGPGDAGPGPGITCFHPDTRVRMADLTYKRIADIEIGDMVDNTEGGANEVLNIDTPLLAERDLYAINNITPFVTWDHPLLTTEGWASVSPEHNVRADELDLIPLVEGMVVHTEYGPIPVAELRAEDYPEDLVLYDLHLDGNHKYYANGIVAHNCYMGGFVKRKKK